MLQAVAVSVTGQTGSLGVQVLGLQKTRLLATLEQQTGEAVAVESGQAHLLARAVLGLLFLLFLLAKVFHSLGV
jgi:cytochrome b561